jgi:glycosyltransferase involved in cell wall biosynthesis
MKFLERGLKMLLVSSYPPRECGLATFSNDLLNAVNNVFGNTVPIEICALQNEKDSYRYGEEVTHILNTTLQKNYREVAEQINERDDIGLVCIQHEFGLFGGDYGSHLLAFLLALNKPVATVFHTVLPKPDKIRKKVVKKIAELSDKIIVLTQKSKELLIKEYEYSEAKIKLIPHGTHTVLWSTKQSLKNKYGFPNNNVLSTFGLLSENKSIETVLYALPEIVKKHPNVIYLIIGKTHPEIIKKEGEKYREKLHSIVNKFQLNKNVIFINAYLPLEELLEYLALSDIYLFTSKDPNQAVSGTLAYAMSSGCAVVSNPIPHAREILSNHLGVLLNAFEEPKEFEKAILQLLDNKEEQVAMAKRAFSYMHKTTWENVALQYGLVFGELTHRIEYLRFISPPLKLDHIKKLTTDFGIIQFSDFNKPDLNSGYTLDDNARALINMVMHYQRFKDKSVLTMASIYLQFIEGIQRSNGWFDNFMNDKGQLTSKNKNTNLEDANGRALWSLGFVIGHKNILPSNLVFKAENCWKKAIKNLNDIASPRAIAYAIKGLYFYHSVYPNALIEMYINTFAQQLLEHFNVNSEEDWHWYEDYMTYANNVLPEAMMYSYLATKNNEYKKIAETSFDFLLTQYFMKGQITVVTNRGWFKKKNKRNFYGEQPIEIVTTIITLDLFYSVTGKKKYRNQLEIAYSWFLGNNHLKQIMYNPKNGASYDGLEDNNININQGAESTLCFMKAQIIIAKYNSMQKSQKSNTDIDEKPLKNKFPKRLKTRRTTIKSTI